jgi:hypothetical protein
VDAFNEIVTGANVVEVLVFDEDITEVLAYMTLEFISSGVANLDCKSVAWLFKSLETNVRV